MRLGADSPPDGELQKIPFGGWVVQVVSEISTVVLNAPQADDKQKAQLGDDFIAALETTAFDPTNLEKGRSVVSTMHASLDLDSPMGHVRALWI